MKTKKRINPVKKGLFVSALFFSISLAHAQQWVDEKYQYDSLGTFVYGTAINFNGGIDTLEMNIYTPICDDINHVSRRPLMIWIHGGAFLAGDKDEMTMQCKKFAKKGYVTATINYRLGFVVDDSTHNCNLIPNERYECLIATDKSEWYRAAYRAVQDGKGALRYLINRHATYRIDTNNVFVAGESAGAFIALGIGLLDTIIEKPIQAGALPPVAPPYPFSPGCTYNNGQTFPPSIPRPDLGSIDGNIEPSNIRYTIKGIGNFYGAMFKDLLKYRRSGVPKPSIFSFHQRCDLVVKIDSAVLFWGINSCLNSCRTGCAIIGRTPKAYGSRTFSNWNTNNGYGYNIHNEFTSTIFPGGCFLGTASCTDQLWNSNNNGGTCHGFGYDSQQNRLLHMAQFFAPMITTSPICNPPLFRSAIGAEDETSRFIVYPNPTNESITVDCENFQNCEITLYNVDGKICHASTELFNQKTEINLKDLSPGVYLLYFRNSLGKISVKKIIKN